ncbi:MAG TPA: tRNA pseudouridine synthase A [Acidobacteriaceae bacterium]|jgi:tRNA pseudouridine38-40 synthase|nr:tRNA pseudouridine synthase A [Acidobacteriaceae bacterium]
MLTNWKVTLAYDGTDFHGWQVQPGVRTIQGLLADAIATITGERVLPQGSGRTDAGVHALEQVASFAIAAPIPEGNFVQALNRVLPASIRIVSAKHAPAEFHARHSVIGKTYQYRVFHRSDRFPQCPPWLARYVAVSPWPLDMVAMQLAAPMVVGEHDFSSFAASDPDLTARNGTTEPTGSDRIPTGTVGGDAVRTIYESFWSQDAEGWSQDAGGSSQSEVPGLLRYTVRGNGFLHHMVRNLVGTFLEVGRGRFSPASIPNILAGRNRALAGPTAPASGLFLVHVAYPDDTFH